MSKEQYEFIVKGFGDHCEVWLVLKGTLHLVEKYGENMTEHEAEAKVDELNAWVENMPQEEYWDLTDS